MYIDREAALKHRIPPLPFDVERGQLRFFAQTIGLTDPVYSQVEAARAAGHRDLPVPLTFLGHSIELSHPNPLAWLAEIGADLGKITHAEQRFQYHATAYAGDRLVLQRRIVDVFTRKGGALEFVVKQTDVMRGSELLCETWNVTAVRHPGAVA